MARAYNELSVEFERDPTDEEVAETPRMDASSEVRDVKSAMPDADEPRPAACSDEGLRSSAT